jgi:hypothetical protein
MLVYVAATGGKRAAENALLGQQEPLDRSVIPAVIFTGPQVATVGMTEAQAQAGGIEARVATLPLSYVPRALAARDTRDVIKLVANAKSGRLLGAHILAQEGGELGELGKGDVKVALPVAGDVHPGIVAPQVEPMDVGIGVAAVNEGGGVNQVEWLQGAWTANIVVIACFPCAFVANQVQYGQ